MARQKRPNGQGTYIKLKDGRVAWRQMVDGETRQVSAKTPKLLQVKVKKIADLPNFFAYFSFSSSANLAPSCNHSLFTNP